MMMYKKARKQFAEDKQTKDMDDVVMEEWKRTPVATCEALVNSMSKTMLENNGGHTKY